VAILKKYEEERRNITSQSGQPDRGSASSAAHADWNVTMAANGDKVTEYRVHKKSSTTMRLAAAVQDTEHEEQRDNKLRC
jgi:hypothetical protein